MEESIHNGFSRKFQVLNSLFEHLLIPGLVKQRLSTQISYIQIHGEAFSITRHSTNQFIIILIEKSQDIETLFLIEIRTNFSIESIINKSFKILAI